MSIKAAINGFGRIGRLAFRAGIERGDIDFVVINAPDKTPEQLAYVLKYDTAHGRFQGEVSYDETHLIVNGKAIPLLNSRKAEELPWGEYGADYLLECTGKFLTADKCQPHLDQGAKVIIMSGPAKDDTPMFVMGANEEKYTPDMNIVSNASCTTNCLAPLAKIIHDNFGIAEGLMTTIHAGTASQNTVDGFSKKNFRLGRSSYDNIIPTSTGAAKAVGRVIPDLQGKLTGTSMRVPVSNVSVVDLTVKLEKGASYEDICAVMKAASESDRYRGIVEYVDEPLVSSDFRSDACTCIFDAQAGIALNDNFVKLIAWYDNEWGYSCKMLELMAHIHAVRTDAKQG